MPDTDPTEEAITAFLASVKTAARVLSNRLGHLAAQKTFAVMQRAFDFEPPKPAAAEANYSADFGPMEFSTPKARATKAKIYTADALRAQAIDFVKKYPGYGVERIAARLGVKPRDLARQLTKAVASGKVVRKGYGRASKYHPGKKA